MNIPSQNYLYHATVKTINDYKTVNHLHITQHSVAKILNVPYETLTDIFYTLLQQNVIIIDGEFDTTLYKIL